jgi:hypothetical protein
MRFNHRPVILSVLSVVTLFAMLVFVTNICADMTVGNLARRTAIQSHAGPILLGDPVGGGIPKVRVLPIGDPVGGGIPNVQPNGTQIV